MTELGELRPRRRIDYESELNYEQLEVVMAPGGPMLVLAGAGSGKTRALVYRVARLIEDGADPTSILLLTFTNKSAKEMLGRVEAMLDERGKRVVGGTFHSVGHRILRRYGDRLGYGGRFSIMDREDSTELMGSALAECFPDTPKTRTPRPRLLLNLYSYIINTGSDLEETVTKRAPQYLSQVADMATVFKRYLERKRIGKMMDFDDLLLNWLILLDRHPDVRQALARGFKHVLVDEYQDTNRLQADIIDRIAVGGNLMVVGDDAQSIYSFRGADFENILGFSERHQGAKIYKLETNYRSRPEILEVANASIENNERQFPKVLTSIRDEGDKPQLVSVPTPEAQAAFVADRILELRDEGVELDEMVVLYRAHAHSLELQVELGRRNIPFRVRSGMRFFEQRHVKDVLAHMRFVDNPGDEIGFLRAIKLRSGFGSRTASAVWSLISGATALEGLERLSPDKVGLRGAAKRTFPEFRELIHKLKAPSILGEPGEAIRLVVEHFYKDWARTELDNAGQRLDDLEQLALFAEGYPDCAEFLSELALFNELSGEDVVGGLTEEMLTLSSVHQAKGLEWRAVFMLWLAEGRFPLARAEDFEEERRLFYVGLTRAKDHLVLSCPEIARDRYRVDVLLDRSRFLSEIPLDLFEQINVVADIVVKELPEVGRYQLPSFLGSDDEPN